MFSCASFVVFSVTALLPSPLDPCLLSELKLTQFDPPLASQICGQDSSPLRDLSPLSSMSANAVPDSILVSSGKMELVSKNAMLGPLHVT